MPRYEAEPVEDGELGEALQSLVKKEATRAAVSVVRHEMHSGPMPSPEQLAMYDAALPGTALIIRDEFQANGAHIRDMEKRALEAAKDDNDRNRWAALILVLFSLTSSVVLAITGHDWVAGIIAASTVTAVITGFLRSSGGRGKSNDQEADQSGSGQVSVPPPKPPPPLE